MRSKFIIYIVLFCVLLGLAYIIYYYNNNSVSYSTDISTELNIILNNSDNKLTDEHEVSFSDVQISEDDIKIITNIITYLETNLAQTDEYLYSLDDRFEDMNVLAMRYQGLSDWNKVGEIYKEVSKMFNDRPLAWYNLGVYQIKAGQWKSASESLLTSLELDSQFQLSWLALIDFYKYQIKADFDTMDSLFNYALLNTANDNTILREYAEYLEQNDRLESAMTIWKNVYEESSDNKDAILNRINKLQQKLDSKM